MPWKIWFEILLTTLFNGSKFNFLGLSVGTFISGTGSSKILLRCGLSVGAFFIFGTGSSNIFDEFLLLSICLIIALRWLAANSFEKELNLFVLSLCVWASSNFISLAFVNLL